MKNCKLRNLTSLTLTYPLFALSTSYYQNFVRMNFDFPANFPNEPIFPAERFASELHRFDGKSVPKHV